MIWENVEVCSVVFTHYLYLYNIQRSGGNIWDPLALPLGHNVTGTSGDVFILQNNLIL